MTQINDFRFQPWQREGSEVTTLIEIKAGGRAQPSLARIECALRQFREDR
ncbi:MAG: hypothetical protein K8F62_00660 [Pseudorhodoplanes sp.]|nr:hypothetical protein [Pseudorhodoplanes sp.]